jgi:hypothetical protein
MRNNFCISFVYFLYIIILNQPLYVCRTHKNLHINSTYLIINLKKYTNNKT